MKTITNAAQTELVVANRALVYHVFLTRFRRHRQWEDDLIGQGLVALTRAAVYFDSSKGFKFSTYATSIIIVEMGRYLQRLQSQCSGCRRLKSDLPAPEEDDGYDVDWLRLTLDKVPQKLQDHATLLRSTLAGETATTLAAARGVTPTAVKMKLRKVKRWLREQMVAAA